MVLGRVPMNAPPGYGSTSALEAFVKRAGPRSIAPHAQQIARAERRFEEYVTLRGTDSSQALDGLESLFKRLTEGDTIPF